MALKVLLGCWNTEDTLDVVYDGSFDVDDSHLLFPFFLISFVFLIDYAKLHITLPLDPLGCV